MIIYTGVIMLLSYSLISLNLFVYGAVNGDSSCDENGVCLNHITSTLANFQYNVEKRNRHHPLVDNMYQRSTAMAAKFRSLSSRTLDVWYDDGKDGVELARLSPGMISTLNTYEGHSFYVTPVNVKSKVLSRFTISKDKVFYTIEDPEFPGDPSVIDHVRKEEQFMKDYLNTTGIAWRHFYGEKGPRPPPVLHMWPAKEVGDVHQVESMNGFWHCNGTRDECQSSSATEGRAAASFQVEAVSLKPRVFIIDSFLSDFEADAIIQHATPELHHSTVGNKDGGGTRSSTTRTSSNTWIRRDASPIFDTLYRRAADVLQIDESLLTTSQNAEDIQVVHYVNGQKYDSHHDWGVAGYDNSRYLTLLLYLTDMPHDHAGGETAFPKGLDGNGFKVKPKKGNAVLFYNLLEDGNGDDLSLHAALPVREGEKWLANFWVWDPKRR